MLLDRGVDGLSYDAATGIWTVSVLMGDGSRETRTARHVISSAPVRELVDSIRPRPLSTFNARALQYRDFLTVALIAKSDRTFPDNWIYIHEPAVRTMRIQNFGSWSPYMVKEGRNTLGLEYTVWEGDEEWNATDEWLIERAKRELEELGGLIGVPGERFLDERVQSRFDGGAHDVGMRGHRRAHVHGRRMAREERWIQLLNQSCFGMASPERTAIRSTVPSASLRRRMRVGVSVFGSISITFEWCIGAGKVTIPASVVWVALRCRLARLTPSTTTRPVFGKTRSTVPRFPFSSPEMTCTMSPLAIWSFWRTAGL